MTRTDLQLNDGHLDPVCVQLHEPDAQVHLVCEAQHLVIRLQPVRSALHSSSVVLLLVVC